MNHCWLRRSADWRSDLAGKKTDSVLAKLFGEKRAEKIEEKLIETGLKRFLEGLDADEES